MCHGGRLLSRLLSRASRTPARPRRPRPAPPGAMQQGEHSLAVLPWGERGGEFGEAVFQACKAAAARVGCAYSLVALRVSSTDPARLGEFLQQVLGGIYRTDSFGLPGGGSRYRCPIVVTEDVMDSG